MENETKPQPTVLTGLLKYDLTALLIWDHKKRKEYNKEREI